MCKNIIKPQLEALVTDFWGITEILDLIEKALGDVDTPICAYGLTLETLKEKIRDLQAGIDQL